jgi:hypothetical protein
MRHICSLYVIAYRYVIMSLAKYIFYDVIHGFVFTILKHVLPKFKNSTG